MHREECEPLPSALLKDQSGDFGGKEAREESVLGGHTGDGEIVS